MRTVILCNGEFPHSRRCLDLLQECDRMLCCDGAIVALDALGLRTPDAVVGDLDSIPPRLREKYAAVLVEEKEQATNDLSKAIRYARKQHFFTAEDDLVILGAGGKREDHFLANLAIFSELPANAEFRTDYGRFLIVRGSRRLRVTPGDQVSFFAPDSLHLTATNLKWPLQNASLEKWWCGTLNEATGTQLAIETDSPQTPLLVYIPWTEAARKRASLVPPRLPWRKVHFCGLGGVGVSGLANMLLDVGIEVSGSDAVDSAYLRTLAARGAATYIGEDAAHLPADADLLVFSAAVPPENPERACARELGIPEIRRGELLARIAPYFRDVIAVSGSHGKTTTTAMIAHVLKALGRDPGYLIGGHVNGWETNGAWGDGSILVTEVDESDRSQELMLPTATIVLNIDDDHAWAVGDTEGLENCFHRLASQSHCVVTHDTPKLHRILGDLGDKCHFCCPPATPDEELPRLPILGHHNRQNAALAQELLALPRFGVAKEEFQHAIEEFPGVDRRLTLLHNEGQKYLFEDYAHHPSELQACLESLKEAYPNAAICALFQPHRPERVLRYGERFAELLAKHCEHVVVFAPFMAWEEHAPEGNPAKIVESANAQHPGCAELYTGRPQEFLPQFLTIWGNTSPTADNPALFVVIGAGDIDLLAQAAVREWKIR